MDSRELLGSVRILWADIQGRLGKATGIWTCWVLLLLAARGNVACQGSQREVCSGGEADWKWETILIVALHQSLLNGKPA